jgi:hypothetical protein
MRRGRAWWIIVAALVVASGIAGGCSTILGIDDVPKPADGGGTGDASADGATGDAGADGAAGDALADAGADAGVVCRFDDDASRFDKGCVFGH